MNSLPLISVLIPVYNVELFVYDAVKSICNQTYQNLEIIVVDDFSTDNTYSIITELSKTDHRIKLYRNQKNMKIAETLNFAFSKSSGEFIARMDGDDISFENKIDLQYNYLNKNVDVDLVGTNYILTNECGVEIGRSNYISDIKNNLNIIKYESPVAHIWLARRTVYEVLGNYRLPGVEDYDFLLRALTADFEIRNIKDYLYKVRVRDGNTVSIYGLEQRKAFNFAYKLYEYRVQFDRKDFFSNEIYINAISSSKLEKYLYFNSCKFYNLYMSNRKIIMIVAFLWLSISILLFPRYQITYIINRYKLLRIKKNANSNSITLSRE